MVNRSRPLYTNAVSVERRSRRFSAILLWREYFCLVGKNVLLAMHTYVIK